MSDVKLLRCVVDGEMILPCWVLYDSLNDPGDRKNGLTFAEFFDRATFTIKRSGVVLRSGIHDKSGIVIRYCPFCGKYFGDPIYSRNEAKEEAAC